MREGSLVDDGMVPEVRGAERVVGFQLRHPHFTPVVSSRPALSRASTGVSHMISAARALVQGKMGSADAQVEVGTVGITPQVI